MATNPEPCELVNVPHHGVGTVRFEDGAPLLTSTYGRASRSLGVSFEFKGLGLADSKVASSKVDPSQHHILRLGADGWMFYVWPKGFSLYLLDESFIVVFLLSSSSSSQQ
jgi:hypothetical protein